MKKVMFIITLILASSIFAFEPHFMKDPEISPSGEWVCFSYFSDLWRVPFNGGIAERLTSVEGNDWNAQYSPNGKKIVFNTNRNGWNEIFIMPAEGGKAELVSSEPFIILDWFPDSKNLLVSGNEPGFKNVFYKLNLNGNYEQITLWGAAYAKLNNKGDRIVFNKRGIPYRETYTGSFNGDIWFYDIKNDNFQRLTNTAHSEMYPVFSSTTNNIYYSETVDKSFQIFKTIDFTKTQQVTTAKELGNWSARKLEIAKNNDRIVFELFDEIWKYDPQKNSVKKLEIQINEDAIAPNLVREDVANKVNAFAVSSDGDFIVFSYKYDLFAVPAQDGEVKQLTKDQAGVEDIIIVDKNIYFTSFDGGEKKLYRTNLEQPFEKEMIKWTKDILIDQVVLSNDHLIVYYSNYLRSGMLAIADSNGKLLTKIEDIFIDNGMESASVSPDGKYLSYLELKPGIWTRHLHIKNLKDDSDKVVYSSESYMSDFFWGKDGQSAFITKNSDIFRIDLKPKDDFYNEEDQWQKILSETKEEKKEKTEGKNEEIKVDKVDIEWEFLDKRIYKIVDNSGWNFPIHVLNDSTLYFMNNFEDKTRLYKCNYFGKNEELVHDFGKEVENFKYCPSSQKFYYIDSNYLYSLEPSSKKVKMVKSSFEYVYDKYLLNKDIFEQVWSKFGSGFYDPDMHGVDWEKAKKIYGEFTKFAYRPAELSAIVNEMIGDVNASHTGYYPRRDNQAKHIQRAYGGFILDTNDFPKRGIRIKKVFQKSKLTQPYGIEAGDILLEVDGEEVGKGKSIYNTFSNKVGKKINMKFLSGGETKEIAIKGLSYRENYSMYYDNWVEERREKVEKLTDGEIGYLHIRSMNNSSYERFLEDLFAENYDKKALIIDVRNNPGGYIHDRLVEVLTKTSYAKTAPRSAGGRKYKTPGRVWEKPIVLLINENSFSDAEIFPNLFKELHLGKVIGMPTSGSVIGTGQVRFMDGSSMRMPSNGWYSLEDENMEGSGVEPDIYVEPTPKQVIEDYDVQLQRAVEELYKELN